MGIKDSGFQRRFLNMANMYFLINDTFIFYVVVIGLLCLALFNFSQFSYFIYTLQAYHAYAIVNWKFLNTCSQKFYRLQMEEKSQRGWVVYAEFYSKCLEFLMWHYDVSLYIELPNEKISLWIGHWLIIT